MLIATRNTRIHEQPLEDGLLRKGDSELLYGESFESLGEQGSWIYGQSGDGYRGYVQHNHLRDASSQPTHFVSVLRTDLYPSPSFKTRPVQQISLGARLRIVGAKKENFFSLVDGCWIFAEAVHSIQNLGSEKDLAATALRFLETPYLYGGRTANGIDCSGLVGLALLCAGVNAPRDSKDMIEAIGDDIPVTGPFQRNDLIYLEGHIGLMINPAQFVNATARYMRVIVEDLHEVQRHYAGGILRAKRVSID